MYLHQYRCLDLALLFHQCSDNVNHDICHIAIKKYKKSPTDKPKTIKGCLIITQPFHSYGQMFAVIVPSQRSCLDFPQVRCKQRLVKCFTVEVFISHVTHNTMLGNFVRWVEHWDYIECLYSFACLLLIWKESVWLPVFERKKGSCRWLSH